MRAYAPPVIARCTCACAARQPVLNVDIAPDGKFAFVEFRDEEITQIALTLFDKMELCGRTLNVGRPRGYVEPGGSLSSSLLPQLGAFGGPVPAQPPPPPAAPADPPTKCLKLEGLIMPDMLTEAEYPEVYDDIKTECAQSGAVAQLRIPRMGEPQAGLVFVTYETLSGAAKAKEALHKRQFDGNTVLATFVPEEPPTGAAPPA
jgi:splicing factor U2AF subunit